ncbi:MAG: DUF4198 domain-containing protein [Planctomycetota bacterium]|nr:DUF4198 domain-containing protein [Planctomycetota bacterium]
MRLSRLAIVGVVLVLSGIALAHDFWIRPGAFRVGVGERVDVRLFVGMEMKGDPRPFAAARVKSFTVIGLSSGPPSGGPPAPIAAPEGEDPAGSFVPKSPGLHVIAYEGHDAFITLEAPKFHEYLREEGLEHVIDERTKAGEAEAPAREAYSRHAKSLVVVGDVTHGPWDARRLPAFEIMPLANPAALRPGQSLGVRVLRDDAPLAHAKVVLRREADPTNPVSSRTDAKGVATLPIVHPGVYMLTCVSMQRSTPRAAGGADQPAAPGVDWVSRWASLTFEVAPAPEAATPAPAPAPTPSPGPAPGAK